MIVLKYMAISCEIIVRPDWCLVFAWFVWVAWGKWAASNQLRLIAFAHLIWHTDITVICTVSLNKDIDTIITMVHMYNITVYIWTEERYIIYNYIWKVGIENFGSLPSGVELRTSNAAYEHEWMNVYLNHKTTKVPV